MADWRHYYHSYLPEPMRMVILARRRLPVYRAKGVGFIHVAKAAGSSVCGALYGGFMGHFSAAELRIAAFPGKVDVPLFTLVRNPWDRLLSAYTYTKMGSGVGGAVTARVFRPEQYAVPEFESFERFVMEWLPAQDLRTVDPVFKPQTHFLCSKRGDVLVDHIGRVETMVATEHWLEQVLGHPVAIGKSNSSGVRAPYQEHYSAAMKDKVAQLYAEDIRLLRYSFSG